MSCRRIVLQPLFLLLTFSCVEIYDFPFEEKTNYLVVEGAITTEPGPYSVTLTSTRNIKNETNAYKLRMNNARVTITTSSGEVQRLAEQDTSGVYFTAPAFRGEVGGKYRLQITLEDGRQYESAEIELLPVPEIDSISITYGSQKMISEANSLLDQSGFFIRSYLNDPASEENAFLVNWDYTYKIVTHPELATAYDDVGCECWVAAPKQCCAICWVEEDVPDFAVVSDRLNNGSSAAQHDLFFLPVMSKMLFEKIYLKVSIASLSKDSYLFLKAIYDSRYGQGGLFDPTPNTVPSNVRNVDDDAELVLGYFYASEVKTLSRFIYAADFPERVDPDTMYPDTCTLLENTTSEEPDYWND